MLVYAYMTVNEGDIMYKSKTFQSDIHYYSPRLLKKLEGILMTPVTVVEAPSGYGKTTGVRDYLNENLPKGTSLYWWSADEDSPETSWTRLCKELEHIDPAGGKELLSAGFPRLMSAWEIGKIINSLCCNTKSVLVLDDFHFLQKNLPRTVMSAFLSYAGSKLHLVIITQTSRPFPLSFFEQANIHHIRAEDLRLDTKDVQHYCHLCNVSVSKEEAQQLYEYTEGWIVALYLIVLQMQRGEGLSPGLSLLQLMESIVWKNMSNQGKEIFFHISLFPSVTIEQICFLLNADPLPESVFTILEETPFVRYDAEEHRYVPHAILRKMLLRRLKAADIHTRMSCYSRAGAWYARGGEIVNALSCFYKVSDYESILSLPLTGMTLARIDDVPFTELIAEVLADCPIELKRKYPISLLRIAYAFIGADKFDQAVALMEEIKDIIEKVEDEIQRNTLMGEWTLVSAYLVFPDIIKMEPIMKKAARMIEGRCKTFDPRESFAFGLPLMIFFHRTPGYLDKEIQALSNIMELFSIFTGVKGGSDVQMKAESAFYRGCLEEAEILCYQAAYFAREERQWPLRAGTTNLMAQLAYKRGSNNDLSQYVKELEETIGPDPICSYATQMLGMDYCVWLGLTQLVPEWMQNDLSAFPDAPSWFKIYWSYYYLGILLQDKEYAQLLGAAEAAIMECRESGYLMAEIYLYVIVAMGCFEMGQQEKAFTYVKEALVKAEPDGLYLPFTEFKCKLGNLVEKAFSELGKRMPEEIAEGGQIMANNWKLLIRISSESGTLPYGLTEREMEVATLAAKGMSNKEIASSLYITKATVKYHLRNVFSKLGIDRRTKLARIIE